MSGSTSIAGDIAPMALGGTGAPGEDTRQFFSANLVHRIALHRQLSSDAVETGIGLALPSLLASLTNLASRPLGAGILACSVTRQYPGALETIRNGIGSENQDVAAAFGWGYMEYLLGADPFAGVCTDISGVCKLRDEEAKLLVGLVGWVLMSYLRREQQRLDMSPSGLADLLRCSCYGNFADARSSSAPVGIPFVHHRIARGRPSRIRRPKSGQGDPCVIHAFPGRRPVCTGTKL
jgi:hypothetical protein